MGTQKDGGGAEIDRSLEENINSPLAGCIHIFVPSDVVYD
jgi:hypothetical protein